MRHLLVVMIVCAMERMGEQKLLVALREMRELVAQLLLLSEKILWSPAKQLLLSKKNQKLKSLAKQLVEGQLVLNLFCLLME